jgi:hypothetical protein
VEQIQNKPSLDTRAFQWFRTIGVGATGTLGSAGAKTISFLVCPKGLSAQRWIYISGGVGTAEAVLVTATTCHATSGAAGTVSFTTANVHSGATVLGSATAGLQEAHTVAANGAVKRIEIVGGYHVIRAPFIATGSDIWIHGGGGSGATTLIADNAVSPVIQVGTGAGAASRIWISEVHVTRVGTPPAGSIGIQWHWYSYCGQEHIRVSNHAIGEKFGPATSLGFDSNDSMVSECTEAYLVFDNAIGINWNGGYLGVNAGGSADSPVKALIFSGLTDTIKFNGTDIIPRGASTLWLASFESFTSTNGVIYFDNVNVENIAGGFTSDAATPVINELSVANSRFTFGAAAPLFSFNAATLITNLSLMNNPSIFGVFTLTNAAWVRISGNFITGGSGTFTGGTSAHLSFSGNTVVSGITFTGAWRNLSVTGNTWVNSIPTITATAILGGGINISGNTTNAGSYIVNTPGPTVMSGYFVPSPIAQADIGVLTDPSFPNGSVFYCANCNASCAAGTGALVVKKNGAAVCQ